jgi:carbamoyl-phosphate synthase large subunit
LAANQADAVNLLFTSAGRRVELLQAFRAAYQELGLRGRILATDIDPLAPCFQVADGGFLVPQIDGPDYIPELVKICREERVSLVFPLIDPDVPALARGRSQIEAAGARLAALDAAEADRTYDKWATAELFRSLDVPHPQTWLASSIPGDVPLPAFVKPRFGSAGKFSFKAESGDALRSLLGYVPDPVVQEFMEGPEITSDVTCSLGGEVWAVVCRRRIEVRWGEVAKGVTVHHPQIVDLCVKIARGLKAIGPITVQCILSAGGPVFTDVNPRFGGGLPLGVAAGVPSPTWYLMEAAGLQVRPPPLGTYRAGVYMTRYDSSYFLDQDDVGRIARRRL